MNIQQLEHLLAVADTGSFSRAAEQVHLTQPALSRSIQSLEDELGAPMFDRRGRRNELTAVGAAVAGHARRIALELTELRRSVAQVESLEVGQLRLGLGPTPYEMLASKILTHFLAHHPRIKIQFVAGSPDRMLSALRARDLDAVVLHKHRLPAWEELEVELLPPLALGLLCRPGHPIISAGRLTYKRLSAYPIVASGSGLSADAIQLLNERFGRNAHFDSMIQYRSDQMSCLLELVLGSDAVFFGVAAAAQRFIETGSLVEIRPSPGLNMKSQFAIVTLGAAAQPPALSRAREVILGAFADYPMAST